MNQNRDFTAILSLAFVMVGVAPLHAASSGESARTSAVHQALLAGRPFSFNDEASEATRTIPAAWVREAVVCGVAVDLHRAVLTGPLDLNNVTATASLRLDACTFNGCVLLGKALFRRGLYLAEADFENGIFSGDATVEGELNLDRTHYVTGEANFSGLEVKGWLSLQNAIFAVDVQADFSLLETKGVNASGTIFGGSATFYLAQVHGNSWFVGVDFQDSVSFTNAKFDGLVTFDCLREEKTSTPSHFATTANLDGVTFSEGIQCEGVLFDGDTSFERTNFGPKAIFATDLSEVLPKTRFGGRFSCRDAQGGSISLQGVEFRGSADFSGAYFHNHFTCGNPMWKEGAATFVTEAVFDDLHVGGEAKFSGVFFLGTASFQRAHFERLVDFGGNALTEVDSACFIGKADLSDAHFDNQAYFSGVVFGSEALFSGAQWDRDIFFGADLGRGLDGANFLGKVNFEGIHVLGSSYFAAVKFAADVSFGAAQLEKYVNFEGDPAHGVGPSIFQGGVNFGQTRLGNAGFRGVCFEGWSTFQDATFLHRAAFCAEPEAAYPPAAFGGPVNFSGVRFHGDGDFFGVKFSKWADFSFCEVDRGLFFQGGRADEPPAASFEGETAFNGMHVMGLAHFRGVHFGAKTSFFAARLDGEARFGGAEFLGKTDFANARFAGVGDFGGACFKDVTFRDATLRAMQLQSDEQDGNQNLNARFEGAVDMRGCVYEHLQGDSSLLAQRLAPFDRQVFARMERVLRGAGDTVAANEVYFLGQRQEGDAAWRRGGWLNRAAYVMNWLYHHLLNYGVYPWQLVAGTTGLLALGTVLLSKAGWALRRDPCNPNAAGDPVNLNGWQAFALSLRLFIPVSLPIGTHWQPAQEQVGHFKPPRSAPMHLASIVGAILTISGWVLVPLGLAVLVGVLRVSR